MIKLADKWDDYTIIATGDGYKLERWNSLVLLRPDPQVIWHAQRPLQQIASPDAHYLRSSTGGGQWQQNSKVPDNFTVKGYGMSFLLKLMGFKHTGLFPEQAVNWAEMSSLIKEANRPISVLNLFGYTGAATVACAKAGASVCHVDAAKAMVDRCKDNLRLNGLEQAPVRYIVDDCAKFVTREIKRGKSYDAILMDPPSYGRGPGGELWKIEDNLADFLLLSLQLLSDKPLFVLVNSYTTGLQPTVIANLIRKAMPSRLAKKCNIDAYEVGLPTQEKGIALPCGCSAIATFN